MRLQPVSWSFAGGLGWGGKEEGGEQVVGQAGLCVRLLIVQHFNLSSLPPYFPSYSQIYRHGIALLLTYKCGSLRMPESQLYRVPLRWLGVRPLQILQRFDLPDDAFQYFSEGDASKCRSLMASPFCQAHPRWKEEVEAMVRL